MTNKSTVEEIDIQNSDYIQKSQIKSIYANPYCKDLENNLRVEVIYFK